MLPARRRLCPRVVGGVSSYRIAKVRRASLVVGSHGFGGRASASNRQSARPAHTAPERLCAPSVVMWSLLSIACGACSIWWRPAAPTSLRALLLHGRRPVGNW